MFGPTHKVNLTLDSDGKPTDIASTESKGIAAGAIDHVLSHLSDDSVVIGAGRTVGTAAVVYGSMSFVNYKLSGKFNLNPLSVD